jgi:hypothetical protein
MAMRSLVEISAIESPPSLASVESSEDMDRLCSCPNRDREVETWTNGAESGMRRSSFILGKNFSFSMAGYISFGDADGSVFASCSSNPRTVGGRPPFCCDIVSSSRI